MPFAGGTLWRAGRAAVLQLSNLTLQANVTRTAGKLPVRLASEAVGVVSYGSAAGYASVHVDGTVMCRSSSSGDFSGQVFMALT